MKKRKSLVRDFETEVREKFWDIDDYYNVVDTGGDIQVTEHDGWKKGDKVKVHITIEEL